RCLGPHCPATVYSQDGSCSRSFHCPDVPVGPRHTLCHAAFRCFTLCSIVAGSFSTRTPWLFFVFTLTAMPPASGKRSEIACIGSFNSSSLFRNSFPQIRRAAQCL